MLNMILVFPFKIVKVNSFLVVFFLVFLVFFFQLYTEKWYYYIEFFTYFYLVFIKQHEQRYSLSISYTPLEKCICRYWFIFFVLL